MEKLLQFLCKLELNKIHYRIEHNRDDTIMIIADVPGKKWEIEFYSDGRVDIEIFSTSGTIEDESMLDVFFKENLI